MWISGPMIDGGLMGLKPGGGEDGGKYGPLVLSYISEKVAW